MKNVIILIDGQNLFYNLKDINCKEKDINWDSFFKSLINSKEEELIRSYWFRPQKILDTYFTHYNIRNTLCKRKHRAHFNNFRSGNTHLIPQNVLDDIENSAKTTEDWLKAEKKKFSEIEYNYDELCLAYQNIEMVKTGVVKVDPYNQNYIGEKGVDISLAVKMMAFSVQKRCDKIILISGDYDYAEAIKFVKDNMTKIHIVKIHQGTPPLNKSVSRDLAVLADGIIDVYETEIKANFLVNTNIGSAAVQSN